MPRKHNFLLGYGQRLTGSVEVPKGGGDKNPPYPFSHARTRVSRRAKLVAEQVGELPTNACPGNEVVLAVTMHPRYISKSDFPEHLLNTLGLRPVGTRSKRIVPESWGIKKPPKDALTAEIFVAASRDRIAKLDRIVSSMTAQSVGADDLSHVEDLSFASGSTKLKGIADITATDRRWFEVVLHNRGRVNVLAAFLEYAESLRARVDVVRSRNVGGLTFVPISADTKAAERIADFSFLRVARSMPTLRPLQPTIIRAITSVAIPTIPPLTSSCRALIFDGGIPVDARGALQPWGDRN